MEELEEDFVLFKTGDTVNKIYVLMSGEVETYLQMADETMILD
jgi:CRP-like cAMP-binding protein